MHVQLAIYEFLVKNNGRYPARIVFFRDGVSEGEYAETAKSEIEVLNGRPSTLQCMIHSPRCLQSV